MNTNEIKDLLNQFNDSKLTEIEIKQADFQLYMNKNQSSTHGKGDTQQPVMGKPTVSSVEVPQSVATEVVNAVEVSEVTNEALDIIPSPIVGVIYLKPAPDQPVFKKVGDTVKKGEVVCIVEAMKVMNEITSSFDGEIVEILVENEEVVEYNQPLFKVKG